MEDNEENLEKCPKCEAEVMSGPECPTYNRNGIQYRCSPVCGNAWEYWCSDDNCDWAYISGLNPMNNRYDANLRNKPSWIVEHKDVA